MSFSTTYIISFNNENNIYGFYLGLCVSGSKSEVEFLSINGYPYEWLPSSATSSNAVGDNGRDDPLREVTILLFPTLLRFRCNKT